MRGLWLGLLAYIALGNSAACGRGGERRSFPLCEAAKHSNFYAIKARTKTRWYAAWAGHPSR